MLTYIHIKKQLIQNRLPSNKNMAFKHLYQWIIWSLLMQHS